MIIVSLSQEEDPQVDPLHSGYRSSLSLRKARRTKQINQTPTPSLTLALIVKDDPDEVELEKGSFMFHDDTPQEEKDARQDAIDHNEKKEPPEDSTHS